MDYKDFSANDFVLDNYFNEWVKSPTTENNEFWETWLSEHPEKKEQIEIAREMIGAIQLPMPQLSQADLKQLWENIKQRNEMSDQVNLETDVIPIGSNFKWFRFSNIAASIILLITFSAGYWFFNTHRKTKMVSYHTEYGEIKILTLPDSSKVFLNANSTLTFTDKWDESADRKVALEGEAFF